MRFKLSHLILLLIVSAYLLEVGEALMQRKPKRGDNSETQYSNKGRGNSGPKGRPRQSRPNSSRPRSGVKDKGPAGKRQQKGGRHNNINPSVNLHAQKQKFQRTKNAKPKNIVLPKQKPSRPINPLSTKKDDVCLESSYAEIGKSHIINCFLNSNEREAFESRIQPEESVQYSWLMPETLTPDNTERLENGKILRIPELTGKKSGVVTCKITVRGKRGILENKEYTHHLLATQEPEFQLQMSLQENTEKDYEDCDGKIKSDDTQTIVNGICPDKNCKFSVALKCREDTLVFDIKGSLSVPEKYVGNCGTDCMTAMEKQGHIEYKELQASIQEKIEPKLMDRFGMTEPQLAKTCSAGFVLNKDQTKCIPCGPGTYLHEQFVYIPDADKEPAKCLPCTAGTWQDLYGSTECNACPDNTKLLYPGAAKVSECHAEGERRPSYRPASCEFMQPGVNYEKPPLDLNTNSLQDKHEQMASMMKDLKKLDKPKTNEERKQVEDMLQRMKELQREINVMQTETPSMSEENKSTYLKEVKGFISAWEVVKKNVEENSQALSDKNRVLFIAEWIPWTLNGFRQLADILENNAMDERTFKAKLDELMAKSKHRRAIIDNEEFTKTIDKLEKEEKELEKGPQAADEVNGNDATETTGSEKNAQTKENSKEPTTTNKPATQQTQKSVPKKVKEDFERLQPPNAVVDITENFSPVTVEVKASGKAAAIAGGCAGGTILVVIIILLIVIVIRKKQKANMPPAEGDAEAQKEEEEEGLIKKSSKASQKLSNTSQRRLSRICLLNERVPSLGEGP